MTIPVRITAVSYLNTLPFIYGIEQRVAVSSSASRHAAVPEAGRLLAGGDIALSLEVPSLCAASAIAGDTDIALVPAAAVPLIPGFSFSSVPALSPDGFTPQVITDFCIGAEGPVETVVLLSDTPLCDVRRVYLDSHSRTSVQLVRVLAREHWRIGPQWVYFADCGSAAAAGRGLEYGEAMVAIGDKVFRGVGRPDGRAAFRVRGVGGLHAGGAGVCPASERGAGLRGGACRGVDHGNGQSFAGFRFRRGVPLSDPFDQILPG